ncbi:MAG: hypothetical protein GY773_03145 [Actinomycetia bacterium]|nr:hypothetical protein [Actinomycetes bacterium]
MTEPQAEKRPLFFYFIVVLAGFYLVVRLVEGVLCLAAWLGWGSCPWSG